MNAARKVDCAICDRTFKPHALDENGFCPMCQEEFRTIRARAKWDCVREGGCCNTPVSCRMRKRCLSDPRQLELQLELPPTQQE